MKYSSQKPTFILVASVSAHVLVIPKNENNTSDGLENIWYND